jgi:hypothetical protein
VVLASTASSRRFKPPWTLIRENSECYVVKDADSVTLAWLYCRNDVQRYSFGVSKLSSDQARRIAKAIARIPEFMMPRRGFYPRGGGPRWREDRPYHVALENPVTSGSTGMRLRRPLPVEQPAVECDLKMVAANRELPASGYALEVDGRLKAEFATARAGREELKTLLPMLQIRIYDAQTNAREEI